MMFISCASCMSIYNLFYYGNFLLNYLDSTIFEQLVEDYFRYLYRFTLERFHEFM